MTSENSKVRFPSFFLMIVIWWSSMYTIMFVFWVLLVEPANAPIRNWLCCFRKCTSGLRRLEITWSFRRRINPGPGAQTLFRHNWTKLIQLLFYFLVLLNVAASFSRLSFFNLLVTLYVEIFACCSVTERFIIGVQMRFDHEWNDVAVFLLE